MYPVSQFYLEAIAQRATAWHLKVEVKKSRQGPSLITLSGADLLIDSTSFSRKATSGRSFSVGGVCSTEVGLTLSSIGVYKLKKLDLLHKGICFDITVWLRTEDPNQSQDDYTVNQDGTENQTGKVHMGYYYIYSVESSIYQCKVTLYDSMIAFAVDITTQDQINLQQGFRTIEGWLERFCESCSTEDYILGVAPGLSRRIANAEATFTIDRDQTMDSYRNAIGYLSVLAGGFAVINREGLLDIVSYSQTPAYEFEHEKVMEYSTAEDTYIIGAIKTTIAGFNYESRTSELVGREVVPIYLNENVFLRGRQPQDAENLSEDVKTQVDAITAHITGIKFRGGSITVSGHPELDVGDCISFPAIYVDKSPEDKGVLSDVYDYFIICEHDYDFHGYSTLVCDELGDPSSEESSKLSSSFKSSGGGSGGGGVTNSVEYILGYETLQLERGFREQMFNALFLLQANIGATFTITLNGYVEEPGDIHFEFVYDNVSVYTPFKVTLLPGWWGDSYTFFLTPIPQDLQHNLIVFIASDGAKFSISAGNYQLIVNGSGVQGKQEDWTGRFDIEDRVTKIKLRPLILLNDVEDEVSQVLEQGGE